MTHLTPTSFQHNTEQDDALSVYDGQTHVGFVRVRNGKFEALDLGGHAIAVFDNVRAAMRACQRVS
jgi:hypothetical protein